MEQTLKIDWIKSEAFNLENCCNDNPLKILGPHFIVDKWIIRVWMPEANEVNITFKNKEYQTSNPNHKWLFEAVLPGNPGNDYKIEVKRGGIIHSQLDPWAFKKEWMGEIDRHLFAEGNHHHIWKRWELT